MSTWVDISEMQRGMALMLQGSPYFAWQTRDNEYRPCFDLAQLERFAEDIKGGIKTVGFYAIRPDNRTRWAALDFDAHGRAGSRLWHDSACRAFDVLKGEFPEAWLLESSPGSFHVVTFADKLMPAADIRALLRTRAPEGIEIFPKQDRLKPDDPKSKGSLLRFPGRHQAKGTWAKFLASQGHVLPGVEPVTWIQPSEGGRLESLYAVATRGLTITGPGERYRALVKLAARLKGRAQGEADADWAHTKFFNAHKEHIRTPYDASRIEFLKWFRKAKPCNLELPEYPLTPVEAKVLASLPKMPNVPPEQLEATLRLFFRAKRHATETGREVLFLSYRYLGERLGVSPTSAGIYIAALKRLGVVRLLKLGHTGLASEYAVEPVTIPYVWDGNRSGGQGGARRGGRG